jgi:hypothetical protein
VLCDRLYGRVPAGAWAVEAPLSRLALHASRLVVLDAGGTGARRAFEAPLAADLIALLHWLDAAATSSPG